jgi:N4-gp56 family major capsid protein
MAFVANQSGTTELADRLVQIYNQQFIISGNLTNGIQSLCTQRDSINGKAEEFVIYTKLTKQTTALTEDNDTPSEAMSDTKITITPAEYGNVVSRTNLVDLQSGGMVTMAAYELAGFNARESVENKMILVGEAGANEIIVTQAAEASLAATNILTAQYVNRAFNKLKRVGIPGPYYALAHSDVIFDIKADAGTGNFLSVNQYNPDGRLTILDNEVGYFGGFRWIESPLVTINADAGAGAVDTYHTQFFGYNAFGYVESQAVHPTLVTNDKQQRFYHIGWLGCYEFGIVDSNAHWIVTSAATLGANT